MGGLAFRAPVLAALFLIVALATLAMPGSANFAGEFLILLGVFQTKLAIAIDRLHRRRDGLASTCCASTSARCTTASARARRRARSALRDGLVLVPLVLAILAFALYPQARAATERASQAVPRPRRPRSPAAEAHVIAAAEACQGPAHRLGGDLAARRARRAAPASCCCRAAARRASSARGLVPVLTRGDARRRDRPRRSGSGTRTTGVVAGALRDRRPDARR